MIWYVLGTVIVVFGGVALLIFLAVSSNRGARTQPQPQSQQPTQQPSQVDSGWEYWGKRIGWGVFGLVLFDIYRKIFGSLPVDWKEWMPSFSWNTFEILVLVAGVTVLWSKRKKKTTGNQCEGGVSNITSPSKKAVEEENHASRDTLLAVLFFGGWAFLLHVGQPYQEVIPMPPEGMLYIPFYGLLLAGSWGAFVSFLWSSFDQTDDKGIYFFAALFAGLAFFVYGAHCDLFVPIRLDVGYNPFAHDPLMNLGLVLASAFAVYCVIALATKNDVAKVVMAMIVVTLWLSQYPAFRSIMHTVFG